MPGQDAKIKRHVSHKIACTPPCDSVECELWQRNAEESPFLRLPPEIRNRIYALALTVGQIHVRYRPWRHPKHAHGRGGAAHYAEPVRGGFYGTRFGINQNPWDIKWNAKRLAGATSASSSPSSPSFHNDSGLGVGRDLSLLSGVCRQLYHETALLPFCLNAWSFENPRIMERYLVRDKTLALAQRRAIGVLVVSYDQPLTRTMERYLGGLQLVIVWKNGKKSKRWQPASAKNNVGGLGRSFAGSGSGGAQKSRLPPVPQRDREWHLYQ